MLCTEMLQHWRILGDQACCYVHEFLCKLAGKLFGGIGSICCQSGLLDTGTGSFNLQIFITTLTLLIL